MESGTTNVALFSISVAQQEKKKPARNAIFNTISQRKRRIRREGGVGKQMGVQPERQADR